MNSQNQASLSIGTNIRGTRRISGTYGGAGSLGDLVGSRPVTWAEVKAWSKKLAMKPCTNHKFTKGKYGTRCSRCGFVRVVVRSLEALKRKTFGSSLDLLNERIAAISEGVRAWACHISTESRLSRCRPLSVRNAELWKAGLA